MANNDFTQVDVTELQDCLGDIEAVANALALLAFVATEQPGNARHLVQLSSALHVLSDYLDIRSGYLRNTLPA